MAFGREMPAPSIPAACMHMSEGTNLTGPEQVGTGQTTVRRESNSISREQRGAHMSGTSARKVSRPVQQVPRSATRRRAERQAGPPPGYLPRVRRPREAGTGREAQKLLRWNRCLPGARGAQKVIHARKRTERREEKQKEGRWMV